MSNADFRKTVIEQYTKLARWALDSAYEMDINGFVKELNTDAIAELADEIRRNIGSQP